MRLDPEIRSEATLALVFGFVSSGAPLALASRLGARPELGAAGPVFGAFGCGVAAVFAIVIARQPRHILRFDSDNRVLEVFSVGLRRRSIMISRIEPGLRVFREHDGDGAYLIGVDEAGVERRLTPRLSATHFRALATFKQVIDGTSVESASPLLRAEPAPESGTLATVARSAAFWWVAAAALISCAATQVLSVPLR
jgi:hypothetical protein